MTKTVLRKTIVQFWEPLFGFRNVKLSRSRTSMRNMLLCTVIFLNFANSILCNGNNSKGVPKYTNESIVEARNLFEDSSDLVWSQFLEDYVLSQSSSSRASKDLVFQNSGHPNDMLGSGPGPILQASANGLIQNSQGPINYHSSAYKRYIPTSNPGIYITKRVGEDVELDPHMRPPVKVVNPQFRPMTNQMLHQQHQQQQQQQSQTQQPGFLQSLFGFGGGSTGPTGSVAPPQPQQRPMPSPQHHPPSNGGPQAIRAVSENDLYLLGAIEKLVYRVDYLESRLRRAEQLIYYLMAGNNQKDVRDPCPSNFTRISDNCYYINSHQQVNWKTANSACKALNSHLAEFEKASENEEIMAYLLNQPNHRGRDYWLGGLNPGLLWIWSNSAKPVNPNTNLTSIAMSQQEGGQGSKTGSDEKTDKTDSLSNETLLNNTVEIKGQGRCLRLSFNPVKHSYMYYGQECTSRHHYICEYEDKSLDNKIKKITRDLKLHDIDSL